MWAQRIFNIIDVDHKKLIGFEDFLEFASIMSFFNESSVTEFLFQLCDLDGDGNISATDLQLFVNNIIR